MVESVLFQYFRLAFWEMRASIGVIVTEWVEFI